MDLSQNMIKISTMITEAFHVRTKTFMAKIQLYNNSYYCCFKAMMLSVFYKRAGLGRKKGKKSPQIQGTRQSAIYSRNLCEAQIPKTFFIHY